MRIGAQVSTAGGMPCAIPRARDIGAECMQVHIGAPQRWSHAPYAAAQIAQFRDATASCGVGPNVAHAPYLLNLASATSELRERSIESLVDQLYWCEELGLDGLVVHVGSRVGARSYEEAMGRAVEGLREALGRSGTGRLLIENTAGMGTSIGSSFAEIGELIAQLDGDERLGVCIDTAHTFEAGYDYSTPEGMDGLVDEIEREVGLDRVLAVHANDSKTPLGSNVDRHENIGHGCVGEQGLTVFLHHPAFEHLPFYLEVPGLAGKGPDRGNIDTLRRLAGLPPLPS
jgi:deoxyribonuclease-4